jgi:hypothetical protein
MNGPVPIYQYACKLLETRSASRIFDHVLRSLDVKQSVKAHLQT